LALRSISVCLRLHPLLGDASPRPPATRKRNIYCWANIFWISFREDLSNDYIITSIKLELIGFPSIDCLSIRHYGPDGIFSYSSRPLLTYLGHSSVTRALSQTKGRKTFFEVVMYISLVTLDFSNITLFLDRLPNSWFLIYLPLTNTYWPSTSE
jgi:hypothetical protein